MSPIQLWWQEPCWTVWGSHSSWSSGAHQTGHWYWRTKAKRYLHLEQERYVLSLLSLVGIGSTWHEAVYTYANVLLSLFMCDVIYRGPCYSVRHMEEPGSVASHLIYWLKFKNLCNTFYIVCYLSPSLPMKTHTHMLRNSDNPRAVCRATVWWPGATQWPLCASHIILHPAAMWTVLHRHDTRGWGGQEGHHQGRGNIYVSFIHARVMLASL